jgi:microsomal triglyceride transfer protein large subunit
LGLALNHPYQVSVAAMKALRTFPSNFWTSEMKHQFEDIFYQKAKKFDTSARTIALDILLEMKPETGDIVRFLDFLKSSDRTYEVKQYLVQKLKMHAEKCARFNEMLKMALAADPHVNNWNIYGGLKGLSTALTRRFSRSPSFNGSLLSVQEMNSGVLKRGSVDLMIESGDEEFSLFSLGLFAGGLSSFISSGDEQEVDPDEDTTATAGMELAIQGAQMRPLTFFSGQGELMGHVWSGTASEPIPAYQGVTLTQDHKQILSLNNGALLDFSALGAFSVDLNGKIEISLWYKNANSEVVQK